MDAAYENRRPFMTEENYERFTGQCPLHQYSSGPLRPGSSFITVFRITISPEY